jgi:uncharacterized membrane protein YhaH (DUF805 family)
MKWFIKCLRHYADFSGRARRREYWMFALFTMISVIPYSILMALLIQIARAMSVPLDMETAPLITALPFYALLMLPGLAVAIRRLHDTGKSGWMLLVALIPIVGGIWLLILMCTEGQRGDNRFGADPKATPETFTDRAKLTSAGVAIKQQPVPVASQPAVTSQPKLAPIAGQARNFPLYTGSGVCDVCNNSLFGVTAYIVPNSVFYNSPKYRDYMKNSVMARLGLPVNDAYFAQMQAKDTSLGSAVCKNCIHMFR